MNYVNACNLSNNFFHLNFQRTILVVFCYIPFLLECFINLIASKNITVEVKRKAMGSLDLVSTLLKIKLLKKEKVGIYLTTLVPNKRQFASMSNTLCAL